MPLPVDVLQQALSYLDAGHSTGRPLARDATGAPCHPNSSNAAAWSLHGALVRAAHDLAAEHVLQTARERVAGVLWERHRLLLSWAELDPRFTAAQARACVLHAEGLR